MRVIIIGSSIAGSAAAYLLSREGIEAVVYEQKSRKDIGKKVCANILTSMIKGILKDFGINSKELIKNKYNSFNVLSKNKKLSFKTEEYEFDRVKLLEKLIKKAEAKGAKFFFNSSFKGFKKKEGKFSILLSKERKNFIDSCDFLIGADGALSEVAKQSGLWNNRKFFLNLQAKVSRNSIKNKIYLPDKNGYNILLGKDFGYYSYIFSSKNRLVIGLGDRPERNVKKQFENLMKLLEIKRFKIEGALIPKPQVIGTKPGIFLIGDAGCQMKFSGGGIIPALMAAKAVKEILVDKDSKDYNRLNSRIRMNRLFTKFFENMSDKRADNILNIVKDKRFSSFPKYRDYISKTDLKKLLSPKLILSVIINFFS